MHVQPDRRSSNRHAASRAGAAILLALLLASLASAPLLAPVASAQERSGACVPREHGAPTEERSPIRAAQQDAHTWSASQRVVIRGDTGGRVAGGLELSTFAGGVDVVHDDPRGSTGPRAYAILVEIKVHADTREAARQAVEEVGIEHSDAVDGDRFEATTATERPDERDHVRSVSAGVTAIVPPGPLWELDLETGSGGIDVIGGFPRIQAQTGSGGVDLDVDPWATGRLEAHTGSGGADVILSGTDENGYDARASATSGGVSVQIPDGEAVGDQGDHERHVRTQGFEDRAIQTTIEATTESGGVDVVARESGFQHGPYCLDPDQTVEGAAFGPEQPGPGLATVLVTAGLAAGVLALAYRFRDELRVFLLGLYTRLGKREILEHETRQQLVEMIEQTPGIHFRELARRLDMGHGILEHHLRKLVEAGVIDEHETASHLCYFRTGRVEPDAREALASTKAGGARRVIAAVAEHPDATLSEVAEATDLALSTVSHHVSRLADVGVLEVRREGPGKRLHVTRLGEDVLARVEGD